MRSKLLSAPSYESSVGFGFSAERRDRCLHEEVCNALCMTDVPSSHIVRCFLHFGNGVRMCSA